MKGPGRPTGGHGRGIGYNRERTVIDFGGINATATEHKSLPLPPIVGAIALVAGVALPVVEKRRA